MQVKRALAFGVGVGKTVPVIDVQLGFDVARRNRVDAHTLGRIFDAQRAGQAEQAMLGHRVREAARNDVGGMGGRDIDDAADALLDHLRQHRLATVPGTIEVDGKAATPVFLGHFQRIAEYVDPGAVDQHIDPAVQVDRQPGHGVQILLTRHVGLDRHHIGALVPPVRRDLLDFLGLNVADDQPGLLGREGRHNRFTNPLGGTGQQYDLVFQAFALGRFGHRWQ
ncbi:hypothetical protein D3C78_896860 [compost metagenome]